MLGSRAKNIGRQGSSSRRRSRYARRPTPASRKAFSTRLGLESLEARQLLAADVLINEIHYDPPVKTELVEFIELYNAGDEVADLSGWSLSDAVTYEIPAGTTLAPHNYLVISQSPDALAQKFGAPSLGPYEGRLSSKGETIQLLDAADQVIDQVDYSLGFPWPTVGTEPGYSIELIHPSLDNQLGGSWRASVGAQTIFGGSQAWSYFKGQSEPSQPTTAWRQVGFDDAAWQVGAGPIGYSRRVPMGTELADMRGSYASVYLRKTFDIEDPNTVGGLTLQALYDDGINVWINGHHVAGENVFTEELPYNAAANSSRSSTNYEDIPLTDPSQYLVAGENVIAVQLFNQSVSNSDAFFDARLLNTSRPAPGPTPGAANSVRADNAAPQMRQVDHGPRQPKSGQDVTITAKISDPDGVQSVTLDYQLVNPGDYIELGDPRYQTEWTTVVMHDDGTAGDETAGDDFYTGVLPGELQTHRRLVRYRITATDTLSNSVTGPYADDPQPNFAYFVYDGVPEWTGSWRPGVEPEVTYSSDMLESLPVYQLITTRKSHEDAMHIPDSNASAYGGSEYLWSGTLVYDGEVYDHIHFRARGGVWRYAMGKNMWKFDFNRGHSFQARDDYGNKYNTEWDKLNFSALIQQGNYLHRGEQGLFESVGFKLFNLAGTESPNTNFVHFRIVESENETGADQYSGDFQGMYMTIEQPDGRFLDEHGLPDGNFYKIEGNRAESTSNQSATQVDDGSDVRAFMREFVGSARPDEQWWRDNLDLERYYGYQAVDQAIHHYDVAFGKNFYYFHNPDTGKWQIHPWDLDLTWADNMYGNENHEFNVQVAKNPDFNHYELPANQEMRNRLNKEYQNRTREILDLLYNQEQTGMLIDEMASFIYTPGEQSFVDADRAMWDYNPIMTSRLSNSSKNGQSHHYYDKPSTHDFAGMIQILKDYVDSRTSRFIERRILTNEDNIPDTPTVSFAGSGQFPINDLTFQTTNFSSPIGAEFAAMEWRIAEITDPADPSHDPYDDTWRRKYEIESNWESGPLTTFADTVTIPGDDLEVGRTYRVRVRMEDNDGHWSHWSDPVQFVMSPAAGIEAANLRITEINYNPYDGPDDGPGNDQFEFIELANTGDKPLDLNGIRFTNGIQFDFTGSAVTSLDPGERVVVVRNQAAFESRYGAGIHVAGQFASGRLSNRGEELTLVDGQDNTILQFTYDDAGAWAALADGHGSSLEVIDPAASYGDASNWRASTEYGGSPGRPGTDPVRDIVINEVLTNTDDPQTDAIELHNTTGAPIDVSGWLLSDSLDSLEKFAIPAGTVIPGGGYVAFDESQFNRSDNKSRNFGLNGAHGDDVWLAQADGQGKILRLVDHVQFGTAATGVSFGRWPDGQGALQPMEQLTLGSKNSRPRAGEVVISEIHYRPLDMDGPGRKKPEDFEFIELYNRTDAAVDLGGWHITGIDYTFDAGTAIDAGQTALLVRFDPSDVVDSNLFRFIMNTGGTVPLIGPFGDPLSDEGGTLRIERPDTPPVDEPDFTPIIPVDEVVYSSTAPWPDAANGTGQSLVRSSSIARGELAASWFAADPTPGTFDAMVRQPGDANEDGQFDQKDIVAALQGGKYLTGQPATWANGDWNGDGLFNQKDIVAALQSGNYLQGPYAAEGATAAAASLRITEINYNPYGPMPQFGEKDTDKDDFEFVELANVGGQPIDLAGLGLIRATVVDKVEGIDFNFSAQTLAPGERVVVVKDRTAFLSRYGNSVRIAAGNDGAGGTDGEYAGGLSDGGEQLTLVDAGGNIIQQFRYNDSGSWPGRADGNGSSLEVLDPAGDYNDGDNWRSSSEFGGSPGAAGLGPDNRVVLNEILAHTDPPDVDMIELMNRTGDPIDITNWYITDSNANYLKYQISTPTIIAPEGYRVFTETQFGAALGGLSSFQGEDLWLIEANGQGKPTRFVDRVSFGATENSVSVGRWPNGEGRLFPMAQQTLGSENTGPKPGDVIISEIHYHATDPDGDGPLRAEDFDFLELYNRSISAVDLTGWRIDGGVELTFSAGTVLSPGETLVLVPFAPANTDQVQLFRSIYGADSSIRLVGPYVGQLANAGETLRLEWPDEPPSVQPDFIPWILEDQVKYSDDAPWPTTPDGQGDSLSRAGAEAFGGFAESWTARTPSPGTAGLFVRQAGDANEDRQFNQLDLVLVLKGQKFGTGQPANWREGDWNGDGKFDNLDIVAALQTGNYLQGPYAAETLDSVFQEIGQDDV